jgi:hypothetical protein
MRKQTHFTRNDVRAELEKKFRGRTQVSVCREIGVKPQNLSPMLAGGPIYGKVLEWLGYRKVDDLYEKVVTYRKNGAK